jgi:hypothetical protein
MKPGMLYKNGIEILKLSNLKKLPARKMEIY